LLTRSDYEVDREIKYKRLVQSALLSLIAPLGWMLLESITEDKSLRVIFYQEYDLFLYMFLGTLVSFSIFGLIVGHHEARLEYLTITDPLTGMFNRRYFLGRISEEYAKAKRNRTALTLAIIDIDDFKKINDKYGHLTGDKVLTEIAKAICGVVRKGETVARVGGEEFALILPECDKEVSSLVLKRIIKTVEDTVILTDNAKITVTISAGIAGIEDINPEDQYEKLYFCADKAMYQSKKSGKNCLSLY